MSGGRFEYKQYLLRHIADEIAELIENNDSEAVDRYGFKIGYGFTPETIAEFRKGERFLRLAEVYAQRIDWLVSDDDGEEGFHRRLQQDLAALAATHREESE